MIPIPRPSPPGTPAGLFLLDDGETEGLIASYDSHEFRPHYHHTWAVGVALAGRHRLWCEGNTWDVQPGDAIVLPPGTLHTGTRGSAIAMLFPPVSVLGPAGRAGSGHPVFQAPDLARCFGAELRRAALEPGSPPGVLLGLAARLVAAARTAGNLPRPASDPRIRDARARLDEWDGPGFRVPDLAAELQLHPNYLAQLFRAEYGIGPYGYWLAGRVELARRRLRAGARPTELAHALGFADQSHFTRTFRRTVGMPPGVYRDHLGTPADGRSAAAILKLF